MSNHIQHDDDEIWHGASKVLALSILIQDLLREMKTAQVQYARAFGDDPRDEVSRAGRNNYKPREDGGFAFCTNLIALLGLDGDAVKNASVILGNSNTAATDAAHTGGSGKH